MQSVHSYCLEQFGEKVYKLSFNGGMTCPNRDGTVGQGGCIFCSAGGSGDFTPDPSLPLSEQLQDAKNRIAGKFHGHRYIAYFQSYTNTYAPVEYLRRLYFPMVRREEIVALSIATRPDCIGPEVLELMAQLQEQKPLWVELGLQTAHERTAGYIRRGYPRQVYEQAVQNLMNLGIHVITHVILGLPGESREDMMETVRYVASTAEQVSTERFGIKLQQLQVLKGTELARQYAESPFPLMDRDAYVHLIGDLLEILPEQTVVHRLTGDGPRKLLVAPLWTLDKKGVLGALQMEIKNRGITL